MKEYLFSAMLLLLVIGAVFDVWFGKSITWRKWLQGAIVVLFLLVLGTIPRCGADDPDRPDGPYIPYRF